MTTAAQTSSFSRRAVLLVLCFGLLAQIAALISLIAFVKSLPTLLLGSWSTVLALTIVSFLVTLGAFLMLRRESSRVAKTLSGGHLRLFLCLGLCGVIMQVVYIETFDPAWVQIFVGAGIAIAAILTLATADIALLVPRWLLRSIDVTALSLALLLISSEVALRVLSKIKPSPLFVRACDSPEQQLAAHQYPAAVMRWGFPTNSGGHYDAEFSRVEDRHNVLVIGDSFSTGIVPQYHHYTTVAERAYPEAELWNLGQPRTGPDGYRSLLEQQGLRLNPDAIVISIYIGNDLIESQNVGEPVGIYESLFARDNVLLYLIPKRFVRVMEEQTRLGDRVIGGNQDERKAEARITSPKAIAAAFPWTVDATLEDATFSAEQYARIEAERARKNEFAAIHGLHDKLMAAVLEMKRTAGDIPFFVMLIPDEYQINADTWAAVKRANSDLKLERDRPQRMIVESCQKHAIPCLDLLPALRKAKPLADGKPHLYHLQNTHLNTRGNQVAGAALGAFLKHALAK